MSDDADTPSKVFRVRTRRSENSPYEDRDINMVFEKDYIELFKIVPPTFGSFIYLESKFRIDDIAYHKGKIILCLTDVMFDH